MRAARRSLIVALALAAAGPLTGAATAATPRTQLYVADISNLAPDEQLAFAALQGIANRRSPRIYLEGLRSGQGAPVDDTAAAWLRDAVPLPKTTIAPYDLLRRFRSSARGLVVWDPRLAVDTQNVATTMAGLDRLLPASPALAAVLRRRPYRLPVAFDLRKERFASREQAYEWALAHLGPPSRFSLLAWLGGPRNGHPLQPGLRDLIVARRGFAFDADPQREHDLVKRILDAFPPMTPVFGYPFFDEPIYAATGYAPNEPIGVGEIARSGKFLIPSDMATNLTVHSGFPPIAQATPWDDRPRPANPSRTYVAFLISDGDNVSYNEGTLRTRQWADPARGSVPMGVSISPWLAIYAPRIYDFYVHSLTANDVLVAGPSGAGYTYPQFNTDLDAYLAQTRRIMGLAGLHAVWILDNGYAASPTPLITRRYVDALHPGAIFADYAGLVVPNPPAVSFSGGVPVVHALWGPDVPSTVEKIRLAAATFPGRPAFVLVALDTWTMSYTQAREVMNALGPSFEAVRPDHFVGLLKSAYLLPR